MYNSIPVNGAFSALPVQPNIDNTPTIISRIPEIVAEFKEGATIDKLCNKYGGDRLIIEEVIRLGFQCTFRK